ncbi:MAG: ABC-2 type transport system permease protein [Sphingobacteriales bacterium]|jgi:ABC-2 type transport system permease protein
MFSTFFFTELKYTLKQPMVYIFLILMTLFTFGATASDNIQIGGAVGNVFKNAPHIITIYTTVMTIFGLLIATAFFNNAALRDFHHEFNEILFTTPLKKAGYFFGRFFGALVLSTIPMLGIFLGVLIGSFLAPIFDWVDADRFGPYFIETFVNNYLLFILPNMFFAGTIIFAMANKWKSTIISFVGSLIIIIGYIISGTLISDLDNETIAALLDTFGIRAYSLYAKYYTSIEKNTLSPGFNGLLLFNRLIWIGSGTVILLLSYFGFSFQEKNKRVRKQKKKKEAVETSFLQPVLNPAFNAKTSWLQFKSFFFTNLFSITRSITFKILFLFSAIILVSNLIGGFEYFGLQSYPLTYKLIDTINEAAAIFVVIILVFFSGELVWRDRENKINEVIDATAHMSFVSLAAKALSLISITVILQVFFVFCGIIFQLLNGFTRIELSVYFLDFLYANLPTYAVWSGVMIMIQVLLNNKYIGYFVSIMVVFIWALILSIFDIQSNMLQIAGGPATIYSDMNAFGPNVYGTNMFNLYWILFSIICLLIAGALWNRGIVASLGERIKYSRKSLTKSYKMVFGAVFFCWLVVAAFVFYNTQILNPYKTSDVIEKETAEYEKTYKKYENVPLPKITEAKYFIDLFPYKGNAKARAVQTLTNETAFPIDSIHYNYDPRWNPIINLPNAELVLEDEDMGYSIYRLGKTLMPGKTIEVEMETSFETKGFRNSSAPTGIVANGTFLNNFQVFPSMGYSPGNELSDKNTRKKYDLAPKARTPELQDSCDALCDVNYLTGGRSDFIMVETVISTAGDQIAIAPGSLLKKWEENGRNYYQYKLDHPSQHFISFMSARYEVKTREWNGIDLEVYYDKKHPQNVDMMLDAVERSLEYYTKNFGPYYHKQCRIIEFPRYASFAQAFPGTMPYSEAIGFIINLEDEEENNVVDAVIAHEMAHQWWAHQVVGAEMQGGTLLSESFSEYSSLMTMKGISKTAMKMREFVKYDHNRYLQGRSGETEKELPLYKVENQQYIHYGKGSVILYALQDYIGEDKVNTAMRNFLEEYRYKPPPYPTSLDFLRHLEPRVPDSLKYLITDWFKEITLYDLRLKEANYIDLGNDKYQVTMDIEASKLKADTIGNETKAKLDEWIDIGVFADDDEKELMFEKRVKVDSEFMTFTFEVDSIPARAAIDPRMILIDRVYDDNSKSVSLSEK